MNWFQDQVIQMRPSMARCQINIAMFYSETNLDIPKPIRDREVDGIIIQGMEPAPQCWSVLNQLPSVWLMTRRSVDYPGDYVEPDNEANGQMAADYLADLGHKRLAVINTDPDYSAITARTVSFVAQCRKRHLRAEVINGKTKDKPAFLDAHPRDGDVNRLVQQWVEVHPRPTGIYLPADHFCGSFLRATRSHRLAPERDFDLILGNKSPMIYPNLSHQPAAIDINLPTLVKKVIDHLIWRIENFDLPGRVGITVTPSLSPAPVGQHEPSPSNKNGRSSR
jgi:DNA-binding LacI/PurR family transcriptional regulator